jgi:transposase
LEAGLVDAEAVEVVAVGEEALVDSHPATVRIRVDAGCPGADALGIVARAALREPDLPVAQLDGPERDVRLFVDHREDLVAERTRIISRLRWHLH